MRLMTRLRRAYRALTREQFEELGLLGPPVAAGVYVSQATANTIAAYWNGVCVIAGDLGVIDRHLYHRVGGDDRERAVDHPAYRLVNAQPNAETTAMQFWETLVSHAVSWGNGYAEIERDRARRPIALHNVTPDQMEPKVEAILDGGGRLTAVRRYYLYKGQSRLEYEDVFHVAGLGFDGVRGYSPVYLARQSLGLTIAAERFGAAFFGNGAWPGIALEHPGELDDEARTNLRNSWKAIHAGPDRAHELMILEEGMKVSKPITVPPDDAQFLETRGLQVEEIARWLNLPPHKLKHKVNERPGGNFEASELDYQVTSLLPWATRLEQECNRKLLSPAEQQDYYVEHNFAKRLKTDTATRVQAQKMYWEMGVLTAEQIARQENLPRPKAPEPGPPPPPASAPTSEPPPAVPPPAAPARAAGSNPAVRAAQRGLLVAELRRFMRREAENARRAAQRGPASFAAWVTTFYGPAEEEVLRTSIEPAVGVCLAVAGADREAAQISIAFARSYLAASRSELLELKTRDLAVAVPALLKRWESTRVVGAIDELTRAFEEAAEEEEHVA